MRLSIHRPEHLQRKQQRNRDDRDAGNDTAGKAQPQRLNK